MSKLSTAAFAAFLLERWQAKDGYIMGAIGENPRSWKKTHWRFTQYKDRKKYTQANEDKALYWREHAERVWDCQGLADGYVTDSGFFGKVNVYARNNYSGWCDPKGAGMIPAERRVPGAAVFWGDRASDIHHVAYLVEPVDADRPEGDWYLVEARGVMYGVVRTKLYDRKPDFWGWMTKYFDYAGGGETVRTTLRRGMKGDDVKAMQEKLIRLGYSCGKCGADGDFGADTEAAVERFQENNRLEVDGIYGENTAAAVEKLLKLVDSEPEKDDDPVGVLGNVQITGGSVWLWTAPPSLGGVKTKTVHKGDTFAVPDDSYIAINVNGQIQWVNRKYLEIEA